MSRRAVPVLLALTLAACAKADSGGLPEFEMPAGWLAAGVQADTVRDGAELAQLDEAGRAVRYLFRPSDTTLAPQLLLVMVVHSRAHLVSIIGEGGPFPDTVAGTADSVITIGLAQSNPFAPGTPDAARFDSLNLNLEQIRAIFRR